MTSAATSAATSTWLIATVARPPINSSMFWVLPAVISTSGRAGRPSRACQISASTRAREM
jgi:hypothetical protein